MKTTFLNLGAAIAIFLSIGCNSGGTDSSDANGTGDSTLLKSKDPIKTLQGGEHDLARQLAVWDSLSIGLPLIATLTSVSPIGDGRISGNYNLTVLDSSGWAVFRVIKSNGLGNPVVVIRTIKLFSQIAHISVSGSTLSVTNVASHYPTTHIVPRGAWFDLKYAASTSLIPSFPGTSALIGGEDARNGVVDRNGNLYIFKIGGFSAVRISQNGQNGDLIFSKVGSAYVSLLSAPYCTTGVKDWDRDFSKNCP